MPLAPIIAALTLAVETAELVGALLIGLIAVAYSINHLLNVIHTIKNK